MVNRASSAHSATNAARSGLRGSSGTRGGSRSRQSKNAAPLQAHLENDELLDEYKQTRGLEFSSRTAVLSLFGMMNWIYTWYNPRVDAEAEAGKLPNSSASAIARRVANFSMGCYRYRINLPS